MDVLLGMAVQVLAGAVALAVVSARTWWAPS
jgi:hypothetical protein